MTGENMGRKDLQVLSRLFRSQASAISDHLTRALTIN